MAGIGLGYGAPESRSAACQPNLRDAISAKLRVSYPLPAAGRTSCGAIIYAPGRLWRWYVRLHWVHA